MVGNVTAPQFQQDVNNTADWANGDENTTVTMRLGQQADSPAKVIKRVDDLAAAQREDIYENATPYTVGNFTDGFTYTALNQRGEFGGDQYVFLGGLDGLPHVVTPATDPTVPPNDKLYKKANYNDAASVANANGGNVQNQLDIKDGLTVTEAINYAGIASLLGSRVWLKDRGAWFDVVLSSSFSGDGSGKDELTSIANPLYGFYLTCSDSKFVAEHFGWPQLAEGAMNRATLRAQQAGVGKVTFSNDCDAQMDTILLRAGVVIEGDTNGKFGQIIMSPLVSPTVRQVETENFETHLITQPAEVKDGLVSDTGLVNVFLNGNKNNRVGSITDWKEGIGLAYYGIRPILQNVRIQRTTGIGWFSRFDRGQIDDFKAVIETDTIGSAQYGINIADTMYESIVYEGPSDVRMDYIVAGWAANSLYDTIYDPLKESLRYPGEDIRGVVFDRFGAEVGYLHSFDNHHGRAFDVINTKDTQRVRMKFTHLMGGGSFGNIHFSEYAAVQCAIVDSHNCTGGDGSRPHIEIESAGSPFGCKLDNVEIYRGGVENGANSLVVSGISNTVKDMTVYGQARAGHGIVISGSNNKIDATIDGVSGNNFDGELSSALVTRSGAFNNTVDINASGCDRVWLHEGTSRVGRVNINGRLNTPATAFSGLESIPSDEWSKMSATNFNTGASDDTLSSVRELISFDNTITTEQSFSVNYNLSRTPGKQDCQLTVSTQSGQTGTIEYIKVNSVSATSADIRVKLSAAGAGTSFVSLAIY